MVGWRRSGAGRGAPESDRAGVRGRAQVQGAHGAPAREAARAVGPRERPSRGPGQSPGLRRHSLFVSVDIEVMPANERQQRHPRFARKVDG
jgi:hypothetical protein